MAARRRGDSTSTADSPTLEDEGSELFYSPGQEKKLVGGGAFHNPSESVGGWVGVQKGLFGNAVKLFENVGDVVTNIVAPLDENDESFDESDGRYDRWGKESEEDESWVEEKASMKSPHEAAVGMGADRASYNESCAVPSKPDFFSPPPAAVPKAEIAAPLSAPSVDPRFLEERDKDKFNDSNEYLGNVSIDLDTPAKGGGPDGGDAVGDLHVESSLAGEGPIEASTNTSTNTVVTQLKQELERERRLHERYRSDTTAKMSQLESRVVSLDKELRTAKEMSSRSVEEKERATVQHDKDIHALEEQLRVMKATVEERTQALERVSDIGGSNSEQLDSFRLAMEQQDEEVMRLQGFLQESEDRLKEHEELTWAAKAEQSELVFALDCEKRALERAVLSKEALQTENEALKEELVTLRSVSKSNSSNSSVVDLQVVPTADVVKRDEEGSEFPPSSGQSNSEDTATATATATSATASESIASAQAPTESHYEQQQIKRLELDIETLRENLTTATNSLKLVEDAVLIERNDKEDALQSKARAESALGGERKEKEQLHVVISQLRSAKRSSVEEIEAIAKERDELKGKVHNLQQAWTRDTQALSKVSKEAAEGGSQVGKLESALIASQNRVEEVEALLAVTRQKLSENERINYDLTNYSDVLQSDILLAKQELEQRILEVSNLQIALESSNREIEGEKRKAVEGTMKAKDEVIQQGEARIVEAVQGWKQKLSQAEEELSESKQRIEDEALLRRKAQLDLNSEKKAMQKSLETALAQLRNSQQDVVDRALIANLVASYFQKGYNKDILVLISKILQFDQEQMVSVGLAVPRNLNIVKSIVDGIKKAVPAPGGVGREVDPSDLEGDSLAELWVSYLNAEAGMEVTGDSRSRSNSSSSGSSNSGGGGGSPAGGMQTARIKMPPPISSITVSTPPPSK